MKLFSDRSSAHNLATFEDKRLQPCLGKVTSGDQSVVTGADDYCVIGHRELVIANCRLPIWIYSKANARRLYAIGNRQSAICSISGPSTSAVPHSVPARP